MLLLDPDVANDHFYDWDAHHVLKAEKKAARAAASFWNPERVSELARLWGLRITAADIGSRLGCTKMAVIGKANRLGLPPRDPVLFTPPLRKRRGVRFWNEDRDQTLREMWDTLCTSEQIGKAIGVTPCAARKRAAALGLCRREPNWYQIKLAA